MSSLLFLHVFLYHFFLYERQHDPREEVAAPVPAKTNGKRLIRWRGYDKVVWLSFEMTLVETLPSSSTPGLHE